MYIPLNTVIAATNAPVIATWGGPLPAEEPYMYSEVTERFGPGSEDYLTETPVGTPLILFILAVLFVKYFTN